MTGTRQLTAPTDDNLSRAIIGAGIALPLLTVVAMPVVGSAFAFGQTQPLAELPWVLPVAQAFMILSSLVISFLLVGRYLSLGGSWAVWTGAIFLSGAVLGTFYLFSWPGLVGNRGLIGHSSNTAGWYFFMTFSTLVLLLASLNARPTANVAGAGRVYAIYGAAAVASALVGVLSLTFESALPLTVTDISFTPLMEIWAALLSALMAVGAVSAYRRHRASRDPILGYLSIFLVLMVFGILYTVIGGKRYDPWWYAARGVYDLAYVVMLFGLLQEGYSLFSRQRDLTAEQRRLRARLQEQAEKLPAQNEELQSQSEELQSQSEELQSQNEELRTQGKEREKLLAELSVVFASLADPVIVFNSDGKPVRTNPATIVKYGVDLLSEGIEQFVRKLAIRNTDGTPLRAEDLPGIRATREKRTIAKRLLAISARGEDLVVEVIASPIVVDGQVEGAVGVWHDVTERERLLAAEQQARGAAEAAMKMRDEFISIAAHELKTPVTSLQGFAQIMQRDLARRGTVDPDHLSLAMQRIEQQSRRLARLTDQLLNLSGLQSGKVTLSPEETDLSALARGVVSAMQHSHPGRRIDLRAQPVAPIPLDSLRIEQVLTNLLDNAIKFSDAGSAIEIDIHPAAPEWVEMAVRDHGVGIPEGEEARIFERFHQAHTTLHAGGMGIGLFVSRQMVEMHGGTLTVERSPDGSTRFVIRLPAPA